MGDYFCICGPVNHRRIHNHPMMELGFVRDGDEARKIGLCNAVLRIVELALDGGGFVTSDGRSGASASDGVGSVNAVRPLRD